MRLILAILGVCCLAAQAQPWPQGVPGAPLLDRVLQLDAPRWGVLYVEVEHFVDPRAALLDDPIAALQAGKVWYGSRVTILQPISAKKRRESLEEQYRVFWPGGYNPKAPSARAFLAWANHPLKEQDRLEYVADPAGHLYGRLNGGPWAVFEGRDLIQAWLGYTLKGSPPDPTILVRMRAYLRELRKARPAK